MTPAQLRVRFAPEAARDLEEAAHWYEEQRKGLGSAFMLSIEASLASIKRNYESFPIVCGSTRRALTKRFPYGVFFEIEEAEIIVLAIFHLCRDPKSRRDRT